MINHIISESRKFAQKDYKTRHDWVRKVIHWELCKKLRFNRTTKCYIDKLESLLKNETHKNHWDFEIQTDHRIEVNHRVKIKENEKGGKYLDLARELNRVMKLECDSDTKGTEIAGNRWTCRDHRNYSIDKIDQNTEKSFSVTQTPGKTISKSWCEKLTRNITLLMIMAVRTWVNPRIIIIREFYTHHTSSMHESVLASSVCKRMTEVF